MAIDVQKPPEQSLNSLVGGIVGDLQTLVKQQLALTRKEIQSDLIKARKAATMGAIGLSLAGMGVFLLFTALALLLYWFMSPANMDPARIPLWGCFGIVSLVLIVIGGAVSFFGVQKAEEIGPLLGRSTQALEENLEWTTKPSTTNRS
jgi:hypothetical protein